MLKILSTIIVCFALASPAAAGEGDIAKDMVMSAIEFYDAHGADATFMKITDNPAPEFNQGELYVFVLDDNGQSVAHGRDETMVGRKVTELTKNVAMAATMDGVWFDYEWKNYVTNMTQMKTSWLVLHDGYVFGAGFYH